MKKSQSCMLQNQKKEEAVKRQKETSLSKSLIKKETQKEKKLLKRYEKVKDFSSPFDVSHSFCGVLGVSFFPACTRLLTV